MGGVEMDDMAWGTQRGGEWKNWRRRKLQKAKAQKE
jgi:hypothetical protein